MASVESCTSLGWVLQTQRRSSLTTLWTRWLGHSWIGGERGVTGAPGGPGSRAGGASGPHSCRWCAGGHVTSRSHTKSVAKASSQGGDPALWRSAADCKSSFLLFLRLDQVTLEHVKVAEVVGVPELRSGLVPGAGVPPAAVLAGPAQRLQVELPGLWGHQRPSPHSTATGCFGRSENRGRGGQDLGENPGPRARTSLEAPLTRRIPPPLPMCRPHSPAVSTLPTPN